ncbi:hypothetical protein HJC23_013851 [Cyclotella cryptica]|uniref:Uncharacterized protein n=1 Tax=Cyclotella cryptica TaxID=29204 RepID=A0ABD3PAG3_9STRA
MTTPKKVSFSETSLLIIYPCMSTEKCELWFSCTEIASFKTKWARTIRQVQSMGMDLANVTDATEYMGLESYLSKKIHSHCEKHRQDYIKSVVAAQHRYRCNEDLAKFARNKSRSTVERSHTIGVFHSSRYFQSSFRSKEMNCDCDCASNDAELKDNDRNIAHSKEYDGLKLDEMASTYNRTSRNGIRSGNEKTNITVARSA